MVGSNPLTARFVTGGVPAMTPICLPLKSRIFQRLYGLEAGALLRDQRVRGCGNRDL